MPVNFTAREFNRRSYRVINCTAVGESRVLCLLCLPCQTYMPHGGPRLPPPAFNIVIDESPPSVSFSVSLFRLYLLPQISTAYSPPFIHTKHASFYFRSCLKARGMQVRVRLSRVSPRATFYAGVKVSASRSRFPRVSSPYTSYISKRIFSTHVNTFSLDATVSHNLTLALIIELPVISHRLHSRIELLTQDSFFLPPREHYCPLKFMKPETLEVVTKKCSRRLFARVRRIARTKRGPRRGHKQ